MIFIIQMNVLIYYKLLLIILIHIIYRFIKETIKVIVTFV
jgi:hypothetical protein